MKLYHEKLRINLNIKKLGILKNIRFRILMSDRFRYTRARPWARNTPCPLFFPSLLHFHWNCFSKIFWFLIGFSLRSFWVLIWNAFTLQCSTFWKCLMRLFPRISCKRASYWKWKWSRAKCTYALHNSFRINFSTFLKQNFLCNFPC